MKKIISGFGLLFALSLYGGEILIEDWDADLEEWSAEISREKQPRLMRYDIPSGSLELRIPASLVTVSKKDINLPAETVRFKLEITPQSTDFEKLYIGMIFQSDGKKFDMLGRRRIEKKTGSQTVIFDFNVAQHIGSTWNRLMIRISCDQDVKVRIDNLIAETK